MELAPSNYDEHPELTFGLLDVAELAGTPRADVLVSGLAPKSSSERPKVKCVIWDLDNTLWKGTLVEDDLLGLSLRADAVLAIQELDRKGILQSVASKNDPDVALAALRHFGIADYFLYPQISWAPKSQGIRAIAQKLNISTDTFAFVDDQAFERAEVLSQHPEVLAIDAAAISLLATHDRLNMEVTPEALGRRQFYQEEARRATALAAAPVEYEEFLRSCEMRVEISRLNRDDTPRVHELTQRTNQLNIWTSRFTLEEIEKLLHDGSSLRGFTVRAADRFGSYGLIGFCVLDEAEGQIKDLMFSCRIQGKLVGEAFIAWLNSRHTHSARPLQARYRPTRKNGPARALLAAAGFRQAGQFEEGERWVQTECYRTLLEIERIVHVVANDLGGDSRHTDATPG
jgi:FkbH-like protein